MDNSISSNIRKIDNKRPIVYVLAFFNFDILKRSLESMVGSTCSYKNVQDIPYDVYVLENLSPHSDEIGAYCKNLYAEGRIKGHVRSQNNIGGNIFMQAIIKGVVPVHSEFVCISEGDVILDKGAFEESLKLLRKYQHVPLCSIDLYLHNIPIVTFKDSKDWVPKAVEYSDHKIGSTGLQFIVLRTDFFLEYIDALRKDELNAGVVFNGPKNSFSDSNLSLFCQKKDKYWIRTKYRKLLHIGWELYWNLDNEYYKYKRLLIDTGQFWSNSASQIDTIL